MAQQHDKLREGLESWENLKRKYEDRRKKPLEDDICRSCLQQMCPNKLQDHLDVDSLAKGKGKGKHDKGKGKGKSKGKDKGKSQSSSWSNNPYTKNSGNNQSWTNQSWNQQSWYKQNTNDSKSKGKGKKGQDKGKGKGDQGKGRKVANVESDAWTQEQPAAAATGDQPEPELTALFTLEDTMAPKSERREESEPPKARKLEPKRHRGGHHRSERRKADEARKKANEDKMKEMSKEGIPQWIHDKFEISSEETTDESEFVSRLEKLQKDPEVLSKLDNCLEGGL